MSGTGMDKSCLYNCHLLKLQIKSFWVLSYETVELPWNHTNDIKYVFFVQKFNLEMVEVLITERIFLAQVAHISREIVSKARRTNFANV
jgi:hypothetical protein